jgi:ribosome-binding protein aMBF1 (putative translation factor)
MTGMNAEIRERVKKELELRKMSKSQLARELGTDAANIMRVINGRSGKVPELWQQIFEHLGLKLVVLPKDEYTPDKPQPKRKK